MVPPLVPTGGPKGNYMDLWIKLIAITNTLFYHWVHWWAKVYRNRWVYVSVSFPTDPPVGTAGGF